MSRRTRLSFIEFCQKTYLLNFSKPAENRPICRAVWNQRPTRIVELGIGTGQRTLQMLRLATQRSPGAIIHYTGIDLFEARTEEQGPGMRLKDAHRTLHILNVQVQLVPGDPFSTLSRLANTLPGVDLIVISKCQDRQSLDKAWFYVPRMLHHDSLILEEKQDGTGFRQITCEELPEQTSPRRVA